MSYAIAAPDMLAAAAADVAGIGSSLNAANAVATASRSDCVAAGGMLIASGSRAFRSSGG
jgi:PE family